MIESFQKISWRDIPEALAILIPQASQQLPNMAPQKHTLQITMALDFSKVSQAATLQADCEKIPASWRHALAMFWLRDSQSICDCYPNGQLGSRVWQKCGS